MNTYAKGPWSVSKYDSHIDVKAKSGRTIANCSPFETNCNIPPLMAIANARLMATSPELLETCKEVLADISNTPKELEEALLGMIILRLEKVIAKAEGRKKS